jgi:hypothetical protein
VDEKHMPPFIGLFFAGQKTAQFRKKLLNANNLLITVLVEELTKVTIDLKILDAQCLVICP